MLLTRILTAIVLVLVLAVVLLWLPPPLAGGALGLLALAGAWEWAAFAGLGRPAARAAYVAACLVVMSLLWGLAATPGGFQAILAGTLAWWCVAFLWVTLAPRRGTHWLAGAAGFLALAPMWVALVRLLEGGLIGRELVIFALVIAWAADVGAYFVGRRFGRTKLAPWVSPNKTWEGALGGLAAGFAAALAGQAWFGFAAAAFLPLCVAAILASIVGDLAESMFKRQRGIKDSGRLLPGHGGVLDRIDSLTAAVPTLALGLSWMGVLP
jgi:phosphatidate cytidylyltransferase